MKYKVVSEESISEFEAQVNAMLAEGWMPLGGVAVSNWSRKDSDGWWNVNTEYCQAMTLKDPASTTKAEGQ